MKYAEILNNAVSSLEGFKQGCFPSFKNKWVFSACLCQATSSVKKSHSIAGNESFRLGVPYQHVWIEAPLYYAKNIFLARFNCSIQDMWFHSDQPQCYMVGTIKEVTRSIRGCWYNYELQEKNKDLLIDSKDLYPVEGQYNEKKDKMNWGVSYIKYITFSDYCKVYNPIIIRHNEIGYSEATNPVKVLRERKKNIKKSFELIKKRIGKWATIDDIENFRIFLRMNKPGYMEGTITTKYDYNKFTELIKKGSLDFLILSILFDFPVNQEQLTYEEKSIVNNIEMIKQ